MVELAVSCACGGVKGCLRETPANKMNHIVCHCSFCQAFANHLDAGDQTLDAYGGTALLQLPLNRLEITEGNENLGCLRLSPKGPIRWYSKCCKTPLANTVSGKIPFLGMVHTALKSNPPLAEAVGPVANYLQCAAALSPRPEQPQHPDFPKSMMPIIAFKMLIGKLRGEHRPSPLFHEDGRPVVKPEQVV